MTGRSPGRAGRAIVGEVYACPKMTRPYLKNGSEPHEKKGDTMKSFAMTLNLKDEAAVIEQYKEYHRNVWPEVLVGLKSIGISKMKIFLQGRSLFMYLEAPDDFDLERDFPRYMESPRARAWDDLMRQFQEPVRRAEEGEWWSGMEQVFEL